ncbi:hypothetical protein AK830_g9130 [Neonectria ditissima]|uniref:Uncharacterized protein n=1 Tax=Neonectria ditissima TaxID=78410 RepID=A0A0P7ASE7_9HYPO|nr:hypothetical protein AK830_g9130 [Neonectria ditissima]
MSQVKNLRAMFEGRGDTSPPVDDRGRSSGASTPTPGASGTDSPRPLSKVRTSFVAIEKDGRIGLQRNPSHESNTSRRRLSMDTDAESTSTAPDRPSVGSDDAIRPPKLILHETIPESPRQPPDTGNALEDDALVFDEPVGKLDKKTEQERIGKERIAQETLEREKLQHEKLQQEKVEQEKLKQEKLKQDKVEREKPVAPLIVEPAPKSPTKAPKPSTTPTPVNGKPKTEKPKAPPATTTTKTTAAKKPITRPAAISTKPSTIKPPAKSPSAAKTPTSATSKTSSVNAKPSSNPPVKVSASKVHAKPAVKKELPTTKAASSVSRPAASTATKKPQPLKTTTNDTGFVKPKPKSPTKPVHLPASLMAPTASSVSKGASGRGTQLRPSPSVGTLNAPARPISRASASTTGNSTGGKTIKRKDSTIGRSRPSLGPPRKKGNSDASVAKKDAPVDESFLARMMRPTQSSSSKTTEKVPITPPRKTSSRPSLSGAESRRETHSRLGSAKKSARKQAGSSVASDYAGSKETSPSPAVEAATVVATTIATVPVPELPSESTHEPSKVNTTEGSLEAATDADVTLATEPKEAVDGTVSTEKPVQDIANAETEASVNPVQEEDIDVTEVAVKEPVVENDKDVTTDELKVEDDADGATEVEAADEPTITTENVIDNETEESIAVAEPKPAVDESEKTEQAVEVDDEPVITEAAPAATESTEEQDGETETLVKEDALEVLPSPDAGKKADIEEITVENTPVEDKKEESENVPKENSAA